MFTPDPTVSLTVREALPARSHHAMAASYVEISNIGATRMEILTPRLRLQPLSLLDLEDVVTLHSDPEVMRGSSGVAIARDRASSEEWLRRTLAGPCTIGRVTFRVSDRTSGEFLGRCGLRQAAARGETELAYSFMRHAWGRGIATEAATAAVGFGFGAGQVTIVGCALASNAASLRVLEKVGMRRVGEEATPDGLLIHHVIVRTSSAPGAAVERTRHQATSPRQP
jgi:ribosomal-protein-alanine N-acetyltransferase